MDDKKLFEAWFKKFGAEKGLNEPGWNKKYADGTYVSQRINLFYEIFVGGLNYAQ